MQSTKQLGFYFNSSLFALLSLLGAGLNYILYPILAHILNTRDFGNFTVIVAMSNQILAILLAFNVTSISLVKNHPEQTAREIAQAIQKMLIWFFLAVSILVLLFSPILTTKLKIDEPISFAILALLLLVNVPSAIWTGYLQGHKKLVNVGIYAFSGALSKLILAVLLGMAFGTLGALWGVLAGTLAGLFILRLSTHIKLPSISSALFKLTPQEKLSVKDLRLFIIQSIFVVGGLGLLQNVDIIFAKAFFSPSTAGQYSGISILSNALYYVAFLLVWIILPEIDPLNPKQNRRVLVSAYKLLGLMALGAIVIEVLFKNSLAKALLGSHFGGLGSVLIYATLYQISLVAVALYAFYLLVLRRQRSFWLALSVIASSVSLPWFFHENVKQLITYLWLAVLLGAAIYYIINVVRGPKRNVEA